MRLAIGSVLVCLLVEAYGPCRGGAVPMPDFYKYMRSNSPGVRARKPSLIERCSERWFTATLDHFSWARPEEGRRTFQQRYFTCEDAWARHPDGSKGPIFFYVGNEADVTLYLNATGLMWESAAEFGALLVFAEHRYYGKSKPFKNCSEHMQYLTAEQALADYAELITHLKLKYQAPSSAVVGFGGSYGGMLAAWMRMKYPHIMDGAIAASAPIWSFLGEVPEYDAGSYGKIVTADASVEGGSAAACSGNVRAAFELLFSLGEDPKGRAAIAKAMRLCSAGDLEGLEDVYVLAGWVQAAWDFMAMGNFPYPSTYILNGDGELPPYPVRVACQELAQPDLEGPPLLSALAAAVGVFYNYSGQLKCFDFKAGPNPETDEDGRFWSYQYCTEMVQPGSRDGVHDMFWKQPFDLKQITADCRRQWSVTPRPMWATINWGGKRIQAASNMVFTNGLLDPWSGGGVLQNVSDSVVAVLIPEGAHHLDLMFAHPLDPASVIDARNTQKAHIRKWIEQVGGRQVAVSHGADVLGNSAS